MCLARGNECLTSLRLVDTLNEMQFLKFFKGTVDGYQTKCAIRFPCLIKDFDGGEGALDRCNPVNNCTPGFREAVAIFLELSKPRFRRSCAAS